MLARDADGRLRVPFTGTRDRISFVANVRGHGMLGGLYVFDIGVLPEAGEQDPPAEAGHGRDLVIGQTLFRPGVSQQPPRQRRVLLRGVDSVTWRYFGSATPDATPGWHDTWSGSLPRLVSYDIRPAAPGESNHSAVVEVKLAP